MAISVDFDGDDLYFGSVKVFFRQVDGVANTLENITVNKSEDSRAIAEERRGPLTSYGPEYSHLLVPAPPAYVLDFQRVKLFFSS
jgi:hypothetical protein